MKINHFLHKTWNEKFDLRRQIIIAMILLMLLTTVIIGIATFRVSKRTIERNYQSAHEHNLQVSSKVMDIYLQEIISAGRTLLENNRLINIMLTEEQESAYFSSKNQLEIDSILRDAVSHNSLMNGMLVVNENGNWRYYAKSKTYSGYLNHYYLKDNLLEEEWITTGKNAKGKEVFYPYDVLLKDYAKDCFCYVKNLINPITQESFGFLVVSIDKKIWLETFGKDTEEFVTNRYMVTLPEKKEEDSGVVYFTGSDEEKEKIYDAHYNEDSSVYLFSSFVNKTTNWSFINVITKQELESDSRYIRQIIVIVIAVMILLSFAFATVISRRITKPLNKLASTISALEIGKLRVETDFDSSEVGKIGNKFKGLVNNNLELRERLLHLEIKEKEAQLLLLQSQINPHFLYNTLDALYFMAIIEQSDDIADMVNALSNMFKRSLNKGDKLIKLQDEIEHMKDYMKIQNFRFHDRYQLHIDIDDDLLNTKILTFLLQPILENAVYHGLEPKGEEGNIFLTVKKLDEKLHISFYDDGIGIEDAEVLEQGYGIKNIKERIHLYYGAEYGIAFTSGKNEGTKVDIVIPLQI